MLQIVLLAVITIQLLGAVPLNLERNLLKNEGKLQKRSVQFSVEAAAEAGRPKSSEHRSKRSSGTGNPSNTWMAVKEWYRSNAYQNGKYLYYNSSGIWFSNGTFFRPYDDYSDKYYNSSGIWFRNGTFWRPYDNSKDSDNRYPYENGKYLYYNRSGIWFKNGTFFRPYDNYSDKYYNSSGIWFRNGTFWRAYDNSKDSDEILESTDRDSKNESQNNSKPGGDSKDKSLKTESINSDEDSKDESLKTKSIESENNSKTSKETSKESQKSDDSDESRRR